MITPSIPEGPAIPEALVPCPDIYTPIPLAPETSTFPLTTPYTLSLPTSTLLLIPTSYNEIDTLTDSTDSVPILTLTHIITDFDTEMDFHLNSYLDST